LNRDIFHSSTFIGYVIQDINDDDSNLDTCHSDRVEGLFNYQYDSIS